MRKTNNTEKSLIRILRLLVRNTSTRTHPDLAVKISKLGLENAGNGVDTLAIKQALGEGLVHYVDDKLAITTSGKSKLRRSLCEVEPFAGQHRVLQSATVKLGSEKQNVTVNCAESPLARLYSRKQKNGQRYFTSQEFESGNRLRRDFENSQMQPNVTANWHEGVSGGNNSRRGGNTFELTDYAIDARTRLDKALNAVGPELAGVTLDICCYLKGFEMVEGERGWPGRSAKLMLKTALSALARHYGYVVLGARNDKKSSAGVSHWGVSDYRPSL